MKTIAALMLSLSIAAVGCGKSKPEAKGPVEMVSTDPSAAAQGKVHLGDAGSGNAELFVEVYHVPKPDKAAPGATTYVVWAHPAGGEPQNLGALGIGDDLSGSLRTVTPMKHFDVIITAEPTAQATKPSTTPLLTARVSRE
jgi:hypothetical protein